MESFVSLFRRETTSKEFIPVIDGLRFLAISMVVLFHYDIFIRAKSVEVAGFSEETVRAYVPTVFSAMSHGVELFFVISGFILAVPFMRYYLGFSERKPGLKTYFLRRLTRLEPPYVIAVIGLYLLQVFVFGSRFSNDTLTASMFASLFYVHNLVFPGEFPFISFVFWSLEIEVQYYILAPFFIWALCRIKSKHTRRLVNLSLIIAFAFLSWLIEVHWQVQTRTLALFLQYFFSGILLCDIYLIDNEALTRLSRWWVFVLGLAIAVPMVSVQHVYTENLALRIASPLAMLAFYLIVFGNNGWKRIFSINALTLTGGMCYSIYLLFPFAISIGGRIILNRLHFTNYAVFYGFTLIFICILSVWAIAAIYFLLVEKPCMKRDWAGKLYERLISVKIPARQRPLEDAVSRIISAKL
ncbi:MAG TPA: acyltransferase [Pyrinomonadaceae bacterium]|jgi:peptidoglycan/LPS O-acetylase OafA/YrhL|nr:acyltransferase [Pyrinomonadaceae bacterium]